MKNFIIILFISGSLLGFSQKKKTSNAKITPVLSKVENFTAEIVNDNFQISKAEKSKPIQTLIVSNVGKSFAPLNSKLELLKPKGTNLVVLSWEEKSMNKSDIKTEESTTRTTKIFNFETQKEVFVNVKKSTRILEKVFLDKNKTASEMQEKMRNEGFDLTLNLDGSITQKSKSKEIKWIYNINLQEFKAN